MQKVLILGNKGMLGSELMKEFEEYDVVGLDKDDVDISSEERLRGAIMMHQPEIIINSAAFTDVALAEEKPHVANEINGNAVGILAKLAREYSILLVHFSTDFVFNGEHRDGYSEDSMPSPINAYGRSKLLGENLLLDEMELEREGLEEGKYFLIRTSYLFGKFGENIIKKFIKRLLSGQDVNAVSDQYITLTYAKDLAKQLRWLIESKEYESGIYHITNEGELSFLNLANFLKTQLGSTNEISELKLEEFESNVKRPQYSVLQNNKIPALRTWQEALADYLE
ncbi:sugar nucleotide-binding protein [Candidatus Peregrinibacteria bacterium]|nr:sugar nucleotide-binding protein [Candidatus Peregrinibacteria bacterium]